MGTSHCSAAPDVLVVMSLSGHTLAHADPSIPCRGVHTGGGCTERVDSDESFS